VRLVYGRLEDANAASPALEELRRAFPGP
jgi:hypothetical protein